MSTVIVLCKQCNKTRKEKDCIYDLEFNCYFCFECLKKNDGLFMKHPTTMERWL